ncbi:MAG: SMI1/KNR4 family protein [Bacteroidota bacterium]
MSASLDEALDGLLGQLAAAGAVSPDVLAPAAPEQIAALDALDGVTLPDVFRAFLERVGSYDDGRCHALKAHEPDFANGMFVLRARWIPKNYETSLHIGDPEYWPPAYIPFLWGGSGDFTVINCDAASPAYGAVYDLDEGLGVRNGPMDSDLVAFLERSARELAECRRFFETPTFSMLAIHRRR